MVVDTNLVPIWPNVWLGIVFARLLIPRGSPGSDLPTGISWKVLNKGVIWYQEVLDTSLVPFWTNILLGTIVGGTQDQIYQLVQVKGSYGEVLIGTTVVWGNNLVPLWPKMWLGTVVERFSIPWDSLGPDLLIDYSLSILEKCVEWYQSGSRYRFGTFSVGRNGLVS